MPWGPKNWSKTVPATPHHDTHPSRETHTQGGRTDQSDNGGKRERACHGVGIEKPCGSGHRKPKIPNVPMNLLSFRKRVPLGERCGARVRPFKEETFEFEDDSTASPPAVLHKHDAASETETAVLVPQPALPGVSWKFTFAPSRVVARAPPASSKQWVPHVRRPSSANTPNSKFATAELGSSLSLVLQRRIKPSCRPCSV